jgi:hypothetical protein
MLTVYVYEDEAYEETLRLCDTSTPFMSKLDAERTPAGRWPSLGKGSALVVIGGTSVLQIPNV